MATAARRGAQVRAPWSVLIVDDHHLFADLLDFSLQAEPDLTSVGCAYTAEQALIWASRTNPDVVLLDLQLGEDGHAGLDLIPNLLQTVPATRIVVLTAHTDHYHAALAIKAGASGYIAKSGSLDAVVTAIRTACQGGILITAEALGVLAGAPRDRAALVALTDRDRDVLELMRCGCRADQIAERLGLAPATARSYVSKVITKLGAHSRLEAVAVAFRTGLVSREHDHVYRRGEPRLRSWSCRRQRAVRIRALSGQTGTA